MEFPLACTQNMISRQMRRYVSCVSYLSFSLLVYNLIMCLYNTLSQAPQLNSQLNNIRIKSLQDIENEVGWHPVLNLSHIIFTPNEVHQLRIYSLCCSFVFLVQLPFRCGGICCQEDQTNCFNWRCHINSVMSSIVCFCYFNSVLRGITSVPGSDEG